MRLFDYLTRRAELRLANPHGRTADYRMLIGAFFIIGYYAVVFLLATNDIPARNSDLIENAMLQLGPPVGAIIYALFRTDKADETRAENTAAAFRAVEAAAAAGTPSDTPQPVEVVNPPSQPVPTTEAANEDAGLPEALR